MNAIRDTVLFGIMMGLAVGVIGGILLTKAHYEGKRSRCSVQHKVHTCEYAPVSQPSWIKPNAENT